jgi:hypothetical protein
MGLELKSRTGMIRSILSDRAYALLFIVLSAAYFALNLLLNQFADTLPLFLSFNLFFVIPYFALTIMIALLVALNLTIIVFKLRQMMNMKKETGVAALGMFGGFLGGACPGCVAGVFPVLASVFGVNIALSSLPFYGFEFQVPAFAILIVGLYVVAKPMTCDVNEDGKL